MKNILLILNFVTLAVLVYFTLTNFFYWKDETAWLNPLHFRYTIRFEVKALTVFCIILPVIICFVQRKYFWIIQSVIILICAENFNKDIFQKTVFINQPTSIQKSNMEIENFIGENEDKIKAIIQNINNKNVDSINIRQLEKYSEKELFRINNIKLKNKKVESLGMMSKVKKQKYHSYQLVYFPDNYDNSYKMTKVYAFGTNISVLSSKTYLYHKKWIITIRGIIQE